MTALRVRNIKRVLSKIEFCQKIMIDNLFMGYAFSISPWLEVCNINPFEGLQAELKLFKLSNARPGKEGIEC